MGLWRTLPDGVYLGECIVSSCGEDLPRAEGNGLLTTLIKTGEISNQYDYTFLMWDFLTFDEYEAGFSNVPYCKRLLDLRENIFSSHSNLRQIVQVIKTYYIRDTQDVSEVVSKLKEFLDDGFEGAVYKKEDHIWKDGTSSDNIKLKNIFDVDLKAVSFKPGNGKNSKTFGSVVCESSCGKLVVAVSGFTDKQREHFTANPQEILGRVISVTANDITVDSSTGIFSLMNPRFNETRVFEKTIADDLVRIQTQKNSMEFLSNLLAG